MFKTKAAILLKQKSNLKIENIYRQEKLNKGQVQVKLISSGICGAQGPFKHYDETTQKTTLYWKCGPMVPDIRRTLENVNKLRSIGEGALFEANCKRQESTKTVAWKCYESQGRDAYYAGENCPELSVSSGQYFTNLQPMGCIGFRSGGLPWRWKFRGV